MHSGGRCDSVTGRFRQIGKLSRRIQIRSVRPNGDELIADGLHFFKTAVLHVPGADDPETPRSKVSVPDNRQSPYFLPTQTLDLERIHSDLCRRVGAAGVVLINRAGDCLEISDFRSAHTVSITTPHCRRQLPDGRYRNRAATPPPSPLPLKLTR